MEQSKRLRDNDEIRINVLDSFELIFWASKLRISTAEIESAVEAVGDSLSAVKQQVKLVRQALAASQK